MKQEQKPEHLKVWHKSFVKIRHKIIFHALRDGFGGLVVSILAEAVGFFGYPENLQYVFLRRGSKIICPMSQLCDM
jgi:hypothetical protein